tara:strand:- start:869 stop:1468 length:600 start_codon:yes stop_codon:yes gene_type:complete
MSKKDLENKQSSNFEDDFYKKRKSSNFEDDFYKKRKSSNFEDDFYKNKQSSNLVENTYKSRQSKKEPKISPVKKYFVLPGDVTYEEFSKEYPNSTQDKINKEWNAYIKRRNTFIPLISIIFFTLIIFSVLGAFGTTVALITIFFLVLSPLYFEPTRKAIGLFNVVLGVIFTITGAGALLGIPMILFGFLAFFWPSKKRN